MKLRKVFSLSLALALQVMPLTRLFVVATPVAGSSYAIIAMWLGGAAALLGGMDAVSGASSISISPATATVGTPFSGIVQYSGSHASSAKSWQLTKNWLGVQSGCNTAYQIAPGLWLTNASTYLVRIGGTPTTSGTYSFTMKIFDGNSCGGGNSDTRSATITISGGTGTAPSITTQPVSQTVTAGGNASFSVVASGTAPLSYQWRQNGTNVTGATASGLSLTSVTLSQAGNYTVLVSNGSGSVTSSVAVLTVNPAVIAPTITTQPVSQTVTAGGNANFSVIASGTAPLSYQWRQNGTNVAGATASGLSLTSVTLGQAGNYTVLVSNSAGSVTSSPAILTVNPAVIAPTITTQPISQTVTAGGNASFSVVASGTAPLNYQWRQNGTNVAGATASGLSLASVTLAQAGNYTVLVSNSAGSVTSSPAILTVNLLPVAPSITTQPVSQSVTAGANVAFSVVAGGTGPLSYQWLLNNTNVSGGTASVLSLTNVAPIQAGSYTVIVTNSVGSVTSSVATLTVNPAPIAPNITTQPISQTVTAGNDASFSVLATGTAPLSYQWRKNGANLPGAVASGLTLTAVTLGQAGNYTIVVSNIAGVVTSSVAILTVNPAPTAPSITTQPVSQIVTVGDTVNFTVAATGTGPLSYQWQQTGTNLPGATASILTLNNVTTNQAGGYTAIVANSVGSVTSSVAMLTVELVPESDTIRPTVAVTSPTAGVVVNPSVNLLGTASDNVAVAAVWYSLNGAPFNNATGAPDWSVWGTPAPILLSPGTNLIRVFSEDAAGNFSLTNTIACIYNPTDALSLFVTGAGRITGATNGQRVAAGRLLKLKAVPSGGNIFSNWIATVDGVVVSTSSSASLTVPMSPHLQIVANFVPNPFPAVAGHYHGLFYETNGVKVATCGSFSLTLTERGAYSGTILNDGRRAAVSGRFDAGGKALNAITRSGTNAFDISWTLDLTGADQITGTVGSESWTAELSGDRAVFNSRTNPCPFAGKYTFVLPGSPDDDLTPEGNSYGTLTTGSNGVAKLKGFLADKTSVVRTAPISKNGAWPLFVSLASRKGVLISWVYFADRPTDDFSGQSIWLTAAKPAANYYPAGFSYAQTLAGSRYTPPTGATGRVLALTRALAMLRGGNLSGSFTNEIVLGPDNRVSRAFPDDLTAVFTPATGLFKGNFKPDEDRGAWPLSGVAFQKTTNAFGYVSGKNKSGNLVVRPGALPGSSHSDD